jgi:hypothetical protein
MHRLVVTNACQHLLLLVDHFVLLVCFQDCVRNTIKNEID